MNVIFLKLRVLALFTFLLQLAVQAQDPGFIYIQAEDRQPFFVKIDKKVLSSSENGYIILYKLKEAANKITIGFTGNNQTELHAVVYLKDSGYLLQKTADKGWVLVTRQMLNNALPKKQLTYDEPGIRSFEKAFAQLLAEVVRDPSIAQFAVFENSNADSATLAEVKMHVLQEASIPELTQQTRDTGKVVTGITLFSKDAASAEKLKTADVQDKTLTDTVLAVKPEITLQAVKKEPVIIRAVTVKTDTVKQAARFIDMELRNPNQPADPAAVKKTDLVINEKKAVVNELPVMKSKARAAGQDSSTVMINSDCKKAASENDFLKLRKNMAAAFTEEEMFKVAGKQLIKTCFTAEQVKNLGVLFIKEEARYKFYVLAYPFVSDTHNYGKLEDQLTDNYYRTRFKAMLSH